MKVRIVFIWAVGIAGIAGCTDRAMDKPGDDAYYSPMFPLVLHADRREPAVVTIYITRGALRRPTPELPHHSLIFALFDDGEVIRSRDDMEGGVPYERGRLSAQQYDELIARLELIMADVEDTTSFGPDSDWHTISFRPCDGERRHLRSWHELYEREGKVIASQRGLSSLEFEGRTEREVRDMWSAEYRQFRKAWAEIREALGEIELVDSEIAEESGVLFFSPDPDEDGNGGNADLGGE